MNQNTQISPGRKTIYYAGMGLVVIGFLSFGSVFVSGALHFGDFNNFEEQTRSMGIRAVAGMAMMIAGMVLARVGSSGVAGSGIILDPQQARKDVEPWSRMTGGVVKDVLDEAGISVKPSPGKETLPFDEQLRRLHKLHQDGIISTMEYEDKKKRILEQS